ncbi:MAG: exo-alpha-sialidase [Verrucomicrobia bacterium]|nr:exo-alpha-sialidase [Verrucomicrobiota bacterium]
MTPHLARPPGARPALSGLALSCLASLAVAAAEPIETLVPLTKISRSPSDGSVIALNDGKLLWTWGPGTRAKPYKPILGNLSADGGRTWGEPFELKLDNGQPLTGGMASPNFVRLKSGALGQTVAGVAEVFFTVSRNEGKTWSPPVKIHADNERVACTNDRALVLGSGRIVMPVYTQLEGPKLAVRKPVVKRGGGEYANGWVHWHSVSYVFFSDDEGRTWQRSDNEVFVSLEQGMQGNYPAFEPAVAELADGRLLMLVRTNLGRFYRCHSEDRGKTWLEVAPTPLIASAAPCSLRRLPDSADLLVIWNQISALEDQEGLYRHRLSCAISSDGGVTWRNFKNLESLDDTTRLDDDPPRARLMGPVRQPLDRKRYFRAPGPLRISYPSCTFADGKAVITYGVSTPGDKDVITGTYGMDYEEFLKKLGLGPEARANRVRVLPIAWFYAK